MQNEMISKAQYFLKSLTFDQTQSSVSGPWIRIQSIIIRKLVKNDSCYSAESFSLYCPIKQLPSESKKQKAVLFVGTFPFEGLFRLKN